MRKVSPSVFSRALLHVPVCVRLRLAKFALWRRQKAEVVKTTMMASCLALCSGAIGFHLAELGLYRGLEFGAALNAVESEQQATHDFSDVDFDYTQFGELQAELLRLRLLFRRVAEVSDLDGGEFVLAVQLADDRYLEKLTSPGAADRSLEKRFVSAKKAIENLSQSAELMLSVAKRRYSDRKFTLSGTPTARTRITSRFGYRLDPFTGGKRFHRGLDFGGNRGTRVLALADGVVSYSGSYGSYGNLVEIDHAGGYQTRYAHNDENLVEVGNKVIKGQSIATMGSTGKSTGTHLHLEVRHEGETVDPIEFVGTDP